MASITKKSDGKYLIRVSKGTGGARQRIVEVFRGPLKAAKERAKTLETRVDSGASAESFLTFDKYLKRWLKAISTRVAPRTAEGYDGYIKLYALKTLGPLELDEIRTHHIQKIYDAMEHRSPTTVHNLHAALNACFSYAVRKEFIRSNPCTNTDRPKKRKPEITVFTPAEAAAFCQAAREMPHGLIFEFALETGMRPEEYLALRWTDLQGNEVFVQQSVQYRRKGGGFYFGKLKTKGSRRRIPISPRLAERLHRHRMEQHKHRMAMKGTWFDHGLVFPNEIGRPHQLTNLRRRYLLPILDQLWPKKPGSDDASRQIIEPLKTPRKDIRIYDLRHSMATIMLINGENPKTVSERLGHASVVLTLDTYSHVLPGLQDAATARMDKLLRGAG